MSKPNSEMDGADEKMISKEQSDDMTLVNPDHSLNADKQNGEATLDIG